MKSSPYCAELLLSGKPQRADSWSWSQVYLYVWPFSGYQALKGWWKHMFSKTFFTDAQISDVTYKQSAMFTHWYQKNQIYLFCFTKQTFGLKKSLMHFNLSKLNPSLIWKFENFHMIIVVVSLFLCGRKRMNKITELR